VESFFACFTAYHHVSKGRFSTQFDDFMINFIIKSFRFCVGLG